MWEQGTHAARGHAVVQGAGAASGVPHVRRCRGHVVRGVHIRGAHPGDAPPPGVGRAGAAEAHGRPPGDAVAEDLAGDRQVRARVPGGAGGAQAPAVQQPPKQGHHPHEHGLRVPQRHADVRPGAEDHGGPSTQAPLLQRGPCSR